MQLPTWLQSSADQEKLALTIRGLLTSIIPVILLISNVRGWHITQSQLDVTIDAVLQVIAAIGGLVGAVMTLAGIIRKIHYASLQK